ncbi:MAG: glucose-1-phosphate thymidylyltransferase [Candidatus Thermoplasmatota archaeon]|nr:glucose-1-phosphate thymidylyltransferase [Candidatus Thermoplasmatota archaeon]
MKGVILHGGSGTRLRPLTYTDVKQLLPIAGKPVSEYALLSLIEIGITEINIIVGEVGEKEVRDYYGDGSKWGVAISYTYQGKPLGIAHAIGLTESFVNNEEFVVVLGDNYFQEGLNGLYNDFKQQDADSLIALTKVSNPSQFGIAEVENGKITRLVEKPKNPKSNLAITGAYFLKPDIFSIIKVLKPSWRNELEITEAFQLMLDRGMKIGYSTIAGWWKDTGTVDEFLDCNRMVLDKIETDIPEKPEWQNVPLSGRVHVGRNVKLMGTTRVLGPCYIGDNTVVEDSFIGPYSSIGTNCHIRKVEIEDSIVMDGSSIEISDGTRISQSLIGSNVSVKPSLSRSRTIRLIVGRDSKIEL